MESLLDVNALNITSTSHAIMHFVKNTVGYLCMICLSIFIVKKMIFNKIKHINIKSIFKTKQEKELSKLMKEHEYLINTNLSSYYGFLGDYLKKKLKKTNNLTFLNKYKHTLTIIQKNKDNEFIFDYLKDESFQLHLLRKKHLKYKGTKYENELEREMLSVCQQIEDKMNVFVDIEMMYLKQYN